VTFKCAALFILMVFWRPQEWLFPWLYGMPVLDVVVVIAILSLVTEINEGTARIPKEMPQIWLLLGLWISAPVSHIAHTYFYGMINSIIPVFKICFFTFLLICSLDRPSRLRISAFLFVAMAITMTYHALLQQTRGYGFAGAVPMLIQATYESPQYYRSLFFGIFLDPNDLAQFLLTCMPFTFILFRGPWFFNLLVGCGLTYYLVLGVLATGSRGGLVGLAASAGMQLILALPRRWFKYLFAGGLLAFLAFCPFSGDVLDASAHNRVVYWGLANRQFLHNPVFGLGYDMFWMVTTKGEALHNAYVACYTDLGLFGFFFWFGLIQLGFSGAIRARNALVGVNIDEAIQLRRITRQTIVASFGFCVSAFFLSRTFIYPLFFLMAMMAVAPLIAQRYLPPDHPPLWPTRKKLIIQISIGTVIAMIYIWVCCILLNKVYY
jgi:putative inorganic carbon (hco3(-)) transporter